MNRYFENIILPLHRMVSGRNIRPYLRAAESRQWLPYARLLDIQSQHLRQLIAHAYENVPFYRRRFLSAGLKPDQIQTSEDLAQIPLLTKEELRTERDQLRATDFRRQKLVARSTGGSTGIPTSFFYDRASWDARVAAGYLAYNWAGWDFGVRRAILSGSPIDKAVFSSLHGKLKSFFFREIFLDTFEMDELRRRQYINRLQRFRPKVLYGYASACVALANQIIQDNHYLSIPSIIASAEMLYPAHRRLIERAFRGQVYNLYGSREITAIGMECSFHTGLHLPIDRLVLEIVRDDRPAVPGECGEIVLTDLQNYGMPFIRYKIGDLGKLLQTKCPCGREMPLLELTHGRITDVIITPEGKQLPGEFFPHLFKEISDHVKQFQVIQERIDKLTVNIVPSSIYGQKQTEFLKRKIEERVGPMMVIDFQLVTAIPPEQSGKHRVTISKLFQANGSNQSHSPENAQG